MNTEGGLLSLRLAFLPTAVPSGLWGDVRKISGCKGRNGS